MTLAPGTRLGPYEIVASLGAGGMGEVYRARDAKLNRDVAIKVLPDSFANDPERFARFTREGNRITPANYTFNVLGQDTLDSGPAYVLAIIPKTENKYLIKGRIWVNAKDYSIVRVEGQPARDPSFWVHDVHFIHTYQRVGQFWFASSTHSTSEIRIFGRSELTIENSNYALNPPKKHAADADTVASLVQ